MKFYTANVRRLNFLQDRFIYRVNEDLKAQLEQTGSSGTKEEPKKAVREGRMQVHNLFQDFNNEAIQAAEASKAVEGKKAEKLEKETRDRVFAVLEGRAAGSRAITQQMGVSNRYHPFIRSIDQKSIETGNTIADAEFALSALGNLTKNLDTRIQAEEQRAHGYQNGFWKLFSQMDKENQATVFKARAQIISKALADVEGEIEEKKSETETKFDEVAQRAEAEFSMMSPQEKQVFLSEVQQEIASGIPPTSSMQAVYIDSVMEGLSVHQRIEVYKKTSFDSSKANKNLEACADGDQHIRAKHLADRTFFEQEAAALNSTTITRNLGLDSAQVTAADVIADTAFLDTLRDQLNHNGSITLNHPSFQGYDKNSKLTNEQRFVGYLRIIQANPQNLCSTLSADIRKKILSGLKWIEDQEAVDNQDIAGFSPEFIQIDDAMYQSLDAFEGLLRTMQARAQPTLANAQTDQVDVNNCLGLAQSSLAIMGQKKDELSPAELEDVLRYETQVKAMIQAAEKMLKALETAEKEYEDKKKSHTKLDAEVTTLSTNLSPTAPAGIPAPNQPANGQIVYTNQADINQWNLSQRQLMTAQQQLHAINAELGLTANGNPDPGLMPFSFLSAEVKALYHKINADLTIWQDDRNNLRPRNPQTSPNSPDAALRNYMAKNGSKSQNKTLEQELEDNRKKAIEYLTTKPLGSGIALTYAENKIEDSDLTTANLRAQNAPSINGCIMIAKAKSGVTLYHPGNPGSLLFVQIGSESGKAEIISVPAPANTNIAQDGLPKGYDIGVKQNFVATPLSIVAA